jgi:hypothetical protein
VAAGRRGGSIPAGTPQSHLHRLLPLAAPWVRDLARGLQYWSRHGGPEPATASLLTRLGGPGITTASAARLAGTVDLATALILGRVLDQVLGPGAAARDPGPTRRPPLAGRAEARFPHLSRPGAAAAPAVTGAWQRTLTSGP